MVAWNGSCMQNRPDYRSEDLAMFARNFVLRLLALAFIAWCPNPNGTFDAIAQEGAVDAARPN